jgi:hypothetical protein
MGEILTMSRRNIGTLHSIGVQRFDTFLDFGSSGRHNNLPIDVPKQQRPFGQQTVGWEWRPICVCRNGRSLCFLVFLLRRRPLRTALASGMLRGHFLLV